MPKHMDQNRRRALDSLLRDGPRAIPKGALARFQRQKHQQSILNILCKVHGSASTSSPFDAEKAWRYLIGLADYYFRLTKRDLKPAAVRREWLRKMASALERTRGLVQETLLDAGDDLFYAWWGGPSDEHEAALGPGPFEPAFRKELATFDKILGSLTTAACRAANDMQTTQGRPKGITTVLPDRFV